VTEVLRSAISPRPRARPCIHADDDHDILSLVAHELHPMIDVISAGSAEGAQRMLAANRIDLVMLDIARGDESCSDLLPDLHDSSGNIIPVIVFSNHGAGVACEDKLSCVLSKMNASLESLREAIRDRLMLQPAQLAIEVV
jgi:DNA-binding NtrC family response regulator